MKYEAQIEAAAEHFKKLLADQLARVDRINAAGEAVDYSKKDQIVLGICGGDGIGPTITAAAQTVLTDMLADAHD